MTLHEHYELAVAEYLRRLQFKGVSEQTKTNYDGTLRLFGDYLAAHDGEDGEDMYAIVEAWRDELLAAGKAKSTVKQYLVTLNIFFGAAVKRSFPANLRYAENPVDPDFYPIIKKKPYDNLLADEDVIKLWKNCPPPHCSHTWERNYAIVCLILATGLRNSEVRELRPADISWEDETITVRSGKGDKFRIVDAPSIVLESIIAYLNSGLRPAYLTEKDYLFGNTSAKEYGRIDKSEGAERWHPFTVAGLSQLIDRHVKNVCGETGSRIASHDLRHLFARIHLNVNGNISELQSALGHSSPEISQIYAGLVAPRRARESARAVLSARDEAAEMMKLKNEQEPKVVPLSA